MNEHQHNVLKMLKSLTDTDAATLQKFMDPPVAGKYVMLEVLQELADLGYVVAKTYGGSIINIASYFNKHPLVMTMAGWQNPLPTETYWSITPSGDAALEQLKPPKPQYLGETPVDLATHPVYSKYTPTDWALLWITMYSGIDGSHHKDWLIAEVTKILNNTQVIVKLAKWSNGQEEERFMLAEPSEQFNAWKMAYEGDVYPAEDGGGTEYEFNEGIPP
ncbi:hypothetical protein D3C71_77690 [compost metagenome]